MTDVLSPNMPRTCSKRLLSGFSSTQCHEGFNSSEKKSKQYNEIKNNDDNITMDFSESNNQQFKRSRFVSENIPNNNNSFPSSSGNSSSSTTTFTDQSYLEFQHDESMNRSLQESNTKKSFEISQLVSKLTEFESSSKQLNEENKLLKRAVSIQDSKLREAGHQNEQLNQYLQQANEIIINLEKMNNNLRETVFLNLASNGNNNNMHGDSFGGFGGMPPPPPDVF